MSLEEGCHIATKVISESGWTLVLLHMLAFTQCDSEVVEYGRAACDLVATRASLAAWSGVAGSHPVLTKREHQVLQDIVRGATMQEIAIKLGRSPHTVHDHIKSVHAKLGVGSRGALVARYCGWLEPSTPLESNERAP